MRIVPILDDFRDNYSLSVTVCIWRQAVTIQGDKKPVGGQTLQRVPSGMIFDVMI